LKFRKFWGYFTVLYSSVRLKWSVMYSMALIARIASGLSGRKNDVLPSVVVVFVGAADEDGGL
jgi:hypothetical protein